MSETEKEAQVRTAQNKIRVEIQSCTHPKYYGEHCGTMICANYVSRCPKHRIAGDENAVCSREM